MAATRETSRFGEGPLAHPYRLLQEQQEATSQIRARIAWTIANVGAEVWLVHSFKLKKDCGFGVLPDSASSEPYASASESDSDVFDCGAVMDRNDQRDHVFPTSSTVSTQSSSQKPNQSLAESLVEAFKKFVGSHRLSRFVVAGVLSAFNRSPFSVVAALVPFGKQIAKRSDPPTDEPTKYTRASFNCQSQLGKRVSRAGIPCDIPRAHR